MFFIKLTYYYIIFYIYIKTINSVPTEDVSSDIITTVKNVDKWLSEDKVLFKNYLSNLNDITIKLNPFAKDIEDTRLIYMLLNVPPDRFKLYKRHLIDIINYEKYINTTYALMEGYILNWGNNSNSLEDIARFCKIVILNGNSSVTFDINKIDDYLPPLENEAKNSLIINTIIRFSQEITTELMYQLLQSQQQMIYNFYKYTLLTHVKTYVLKHFALKTLEELGIGSFKKNLIIIKNKYKDDVNNIARVFNFAMSSASCDLWRNNSSKYTKGETFEDIFGLAQARILHIENLDKGKCNKKCEYFADKTLVNCNRDQFCKRQKCRTALRCSTMEKDLEICYGDRDSKRKYFHIKNGNAMWGKNFNSCSEISKLTSYTRLLHGGWCPYCMCTCLKTSDFNLRPEIYINLRTVMANIAENRILTGVRFVKYNGIIHLQIQEGTLLPYGSVKNVQWVPIKDYKLSDRRVYEEKDYHKLSWDSRALDLDVLKAPNEYVVTSLQFKVVQKHLKLGILVNPIDYKNGKLILPFNNISHFMYNRQLAQKRINLFEPDIPILGKNYRPNFEENHFIEFQLTDLKKDAGQAIVPYFDCQPVYSSVPVPLQGIGMFYKEQMGYGGFIAPKIITYNFTTNIVVDCTIQNCSFSSTWFWPTSTSDSFSTTTFSTTEKTSSIVQSISTQATTPITSTTTTPASTTSFNRITTTTKEIIVENESHTKISIIFVLALVVMITLILAGLCVIVAFLFKMYPFDDMRDSRESTEVKR